MELDITFSDKIPWMDSKLTSIKLIPSICHGEESQDAPIEVQGSDEGEILVETGRKVQGFVPDFIITGNGDAFIFSYLYSKAQKHQVSFDLNGDPDAKPRISHSTHSEGSTRFSYERIKYVPRRSASIGGYTLTAKTHSSMTVPIQGALRNCKNL
ncbi:MAG: hypothetical protein JRN52_03640 [Nitrososphaerota archaeon]|nr:hypothetical protein [Nitrososphaerota archaeon]